MNSLYHPSNKRGLFHKRVFIPNKTLVEPAPPSSVAIGGRIGFTNLNIGLVPAGGLPKATLDLGALNINKNNALSALQRIKPLGKGGALKHGASKRENIRMIF